MTDEITLDAPETRLERFLAAAAGVDGITLDEPVTRIEKYLYKIAQGSGGGSGGGVLVVTDTDGTLDKTWQEIVDADLAVIRQEINAEDDPPPRGFVSPVIYHTIDLKSGGYTIGVLAEEDGAVSIRYYTASSASGYPEG